MAGKNIQIKNQTGDLLYPKTKAAVVLNNAGDNLGAVEAGAQVNKIEKIKVNGVELSIASKEVDITIPAQSEYAISKLENADDGFAATYQLTKDNVAFGQKINIPKDMVVSAGEVKKATAANTPVNGLAKGDPYIELTIANNDGTKLYIPVKDLVDVYTEGNGITITNNEVAIDTDVVATKGTTLAHYGIADAKIEGGVITLGGNTITPITSHQDITGKQDKIDADHKLSASFVSGLANVATSGSYNDLNDQPSIPTVVDTYSATGTDAVSGKAVASAISTLNALTYVELA